MRSLNWELQGRVQYEIQVKLPDGLYGATGRAFGLNNIRRSLRVGVVEGLIIHD